MGDKHLRSRRRGGGVNTVMCVSTSHSAAFPSFTVFIVLVAFCVLCKHNMGYTNIHLKKAFDWPFKAWLNDWVMCTQTHRSRYVNKWRGDRRIRKSRASKRAGCDNLNLRGRNKVELTELCVDGNELPSLEKLLLARSPLHRKFQFLLFCRCPDPCCQSQSSRAQRCAAWEIYNSSTTNTHTVPFFSIRRLHNLESECVLGQSLSRWTGVWRGPAVCLHRL